MSLYLRRLEGLAPLVAAALPRIAPLSAPAEAPRAAGPLDRRHPGAQRRSERLALGAAAHLQLALHACAHRQQSSQLEPCTVIFGRLWQRGLRFWEGVWRQGRTYRGRVGAGRGRGG